MSLLNFWLYPEFVNCSVKLFKCFLWTSAPNSILVFLSRLRHSCVRIVLFFKKLSVESAKIQNQFYSVPPRLHPPCIQNAVNSRFDLDSTMHKIEMSLTKLCNKYLQILFLQMRPIAYNQIFHLSNELKIIDDNKLRKHFAWLIFLNNFFRIFHTQNKKKVPSLWKPYSEW